MHTNMTTIFLFKICCIDYWKKAPSHCWTLGHRHMAENNLLDGWIPFNKRFLQFHDKDSTKHLFVVS